MYFSIVQLDPLIPIIPEVPYERIPSPVEGQPIWDSEESTSDFSSPVSTSTPALSFINGKQEVSIEPEKTYVEKEARGDVFETVSTLQNLTEMEEKVETSSNFDYSLVDIGATKDGPLESSQGKTYPVPVFLSTVEPTYFDIDQITVESTPPTSLLLDPETETFMEEGLLPNTPSGFTTERKFSPKPHQPSASPTNEIATTGAPSKPIDTSEEISLPSEDGSGQETATIQVIEVTQKSTTIQASENNPLLPSLTDTTDITSSASSYQTTDLGIKDYAFTTETPMSATLPSDKDTTEKPAVLKSTIMVTSSPGIEGITPTKPLFIAEEEGSSGESHDFIFTLPTVEHTVTNDMTSHRPPTPNVLVLQTEETLLATPSKLNGIDSSENILSTQEEQKLSASGTVPTVSKDVPSVSFSFSEADGSGDQSDVMSTTESSTVYPLHTITNSEQYITMTTATVQLLMTEEGSGDQSPTAETMATEVPSKSSEVSVTDDSKTILSSASSEMETTEKTSVESISQVLTSTFTKTTTTIATATIITSDAFSTQPFSIRYESNESHNTSAPTHDMSLSEGSGEESGEFEDGVSGDFSNTVVESTPPSQPPSIKSEVIKTELPIHPTVPSTVTSTVLAFTATDGSGDQYVDTLNTASVTSATLVSTDANKDFSVRTDEAEISYTKTTLDYSDVEMATRYTKLTTESTSQIPSISAQTESLSSLEFGSGDTDETTTETEGADDGSGDAVSTVLESSPPFVSPAVDHVTEMPTTEVNTEFSVKTDEAETSEKTVETSTQYTLFKSESTSKMPNLAVSSDTGSGDMEDTTSEGTEDEGSADDSSGALIESAAPSQSPTSDITTERTKVSIHADVTSVVPTPTSTDSFVKQSTVPTVPMITGTDSLYLTSKHVDIDSVFLTTDIDKGTVTVLTEDGGSGSEMLVTTTSELPKSVSTTNVPTESPYSTPTDKVSVQTSPNSVATDTDVTTPVLSVIYHDSTDKEVTTAVPSGSEIRSSKITEKLHDTKSITSPVIIFTEEVKDEEKLFSTVTDSMRDHSTKIEITTKDDNIIDADTASPASSFASTIITEEAAGITAVTITPRSSSILTEEPEGSGTDKPVLPSSDLEGTITKIIDLSSSVKAVETESTFTVDIRDEGYTAHTVSPSKMTLLLSTSTHSAQTTLTSTHSTTHYNTEISLPSQATLPMDYSTNQPTSDSAYTTSQHSPTFTEHIHTTTSQPKSMEVEDSDSTSLPLVEGIPEWTSVNVSEIEISSPLLPEESSGDRVSEIFTERSPTVSTDHSDFSTTDSDVLLSETDSTSFAPPTVTTSRFHPETVFEVTLVAQPTKGPSAADNLSTATTSNVSEEQETVGEIEEMNYTTSSADGDTTASPKDILDYTMLVEVSSSDPETLNGTQTPGLNIDLGYTVVGETYNIAGVTFLRSNYQCFSDSSNCTTLMSYNSYKSV